MAAMPQCRNVSAEALCAGFHKPFRSSNTSPALALTESANGVGVPGYLVSAGGRGWQLARGMTPAA